MTIELGQTSLGALNRRPTLATQAYDAVKDSIVTGVMGPGTDHTEAGLARTLGISRAPLREAIRQLEEEGLIEEGSKPGFTVSPLNRQSIADIYAVRFALECAAAEAAAGRIPAPQVEAMAMAMRSIDPAADPEYASSVRTMDFEFHDLWVRNSGNQLLERHIGRLRDHVLRVSHHVVAPLEHYLASHQEHLAILDALEADDEAAFTAGVAVHIRGVSDRILAAFQD